MCEVFGKRVQVQLEVSGKRFIIIHGTDINSNISGWTDTRHDHQEADTLLLCVINKLVQLPELCTAGPLTFRLISPDTDVFMLSLVSLLPSINTIFEQLTSKGRKMVSTKLDHMLVTRFWEYIYILRLHGSIQSNYEGKSPEHIYPHEK